jgi:short-subunit dehydrogenase
MRLISLFAPQMIERRSGHIVNISSLAGWIGSPGLGAYSAAKFGLRGFGESLGDELRPFNIQVTTVYPFFSKTPILDSPQYGTLKGAELPDRLLSKPEDVIRNVVRGIERNQRHVFPDPTARTLHWIKRLFPSLLPLLTR